MAHQFDPWGPISTVLYEINSSDIVEEAISFTGILIEWPYGYANSDRIRAYKPVINTAYSALEDEQKGIFAQNVAKYLVSSRPELLEKLSAALSNIGWTISGEGKLATQDSFVSEQFFPAGTAHDAYVAIREILHSAIGKLIIVDPYLGMSLFTTISAMNVSKLGQLNIQLLTVANNLKPDFKLEAFKFSKQHSTVSLEIRDVPDFHDRFIIVDDEMYYHIGSSVKDAGDRAFMINRLRDQPIIDLLKQYVSNSWISGISVPY